MRERIKLETSDCSISYISEVPKDDSSEFTLSCEKEQ